MTDSYALLETFVEEYNQRGNSPGQETLAGIGSTALGESPTFLYERTEDSPDLTERQYLVLGLASLGGTIEEVATVLKLEEDDIATTRDELIDLFVPGKNMPAVVNKSILTGYLPVKVEENPTHEALSDAEILISIMIAGGYTDAVIAQRLKVRKGQLRDMNKAMFDKVRAAGDPPTGRTHHVLRLYELGIFKNRDKICEAIGRLASDPALNRQTSPTNR